jgi:hypothetical protein
MKQFKLKKDIVIKAGTIFNCIDGSTHNYAEDNYSVLFDLGKDSCGEVVYSGINDDDKMREEWFEEIK